MEGILIAFSLPTGKNKTKSSAFTKAFYGQETSCQNGRYRYRRRGLLDDIPHLKIIRGVIIIRPEDAKKVTDFLGKYGAICHIRTVLLTDEDKKCLSLASD